MFDWLRNATQSAEGLTQQQINDYVDGQLSADEHARFEAELAQQPALQQQVSELQFIKSTLSELPTVRAPRHFTLDPAVYAKSKPSWELRLYPALQATTALAALLFMVAAVFTIWRPMGSVANFTAENDSAEIVALEIDDREQAAPLAAPQAAERAVEADADLVSQETSADTLMSDDSAEEMGMADEAADEETELFIPMIELDSEDEAADSSLANADIQSTIADEAAAQEFGLNDDGSTITTLADDPNSALGQSLQADGIRPAVAWMLALGILLALLMLTTIWLRGRQY